MTNRLSASTNKHWNRAAHELAEVLNALRHRTKIEFDIDSSSKTPRISLNPNVRRLFTCMSHVTIVSGIVKGIYLMEIARCVSNQMVLDSQFSVAQWDGLIRAECYRIRGRFDEDLVQEVWERVLHAWTHWKRPAKEKFFVWLKVATRNAAFRFLKKSGRSKCICLVSSEQLEHQISDADAGYADDSPVKWDSVEQELSKCSPKERQAFLAANHWPGSPSISDVASQWHRHPERVRQVARDVKKRIRNVANGGGRR